MLTTHRTYVHVMLCTVHHVDSLTHVGQHLLVSCGYGVVLTNQVSMSEMESGCIYLTNALLGNWATML